MQIGSESIAVPFIELGGDPTSFDPDWRAKVANAISDGYSEKKLPKQLRDKQITQHASFLKEFKGRTELSEVFGKYPWNGLAMNWASGNNGSKSKQYLEALLLTDQPLSVVAQDLQLDEKFVKLYCDLYFACRSDKDKYEMVLPPETRLSFAFGEISHDTRSLPSATLWKVMAVRSGYSALVRHWGTEKTAHGSLEDGAASFDRNMWLANSNMEQQLRTGQVGFRSLVEMQSAWMGFRKMKDNEEGRDGTNSDAYRTLEGIMTVIRPKLADQEEEQKAEVKAEGKKRLAQKNIESHTSDEKIDDKGIDEEFNKLKMKKFKSVDANIGRPK